VPLQLICAFAKKTSISFALPNLQNIVRKTQTDRGRQMPSKTATKVVFLPSPHGTCDFCHRFSAFAIGSSICWRLWQCGAGPVLPLAKKWPANRRATANTRAEVAELTPLLAFRLGPSRQCGPAFLTASRRWNTVRRNVLPLTFHSFDFRVSR